MVACLFIIGQSEGLMQSAGLHAGQDKRPCEYPIRQDPLKAHLAKLCKRTAKTILVSSDVS